MLGIKHLANIECQQNAKVGEVKYQQSRGDDGRRGQNHCQEAFIKKRYTVFPAVTCRVPMIKYPMHKQIENTSYS